MSSLDRNGLPSAPFAERTLLGALLVDSSRYSEYRDVLSERDFSLDKHRVIWAAFRRLSDSGVGIDRVTVAQSLTENERGIVGGLTGIATLDEGMPMLYQLDGYVAQIREASTKRRLVVAAHELQLAALEPQTPSGELLDRARGLVQEVAADAPGTESEWQTAQDVFMAADGFDKYLNVGTAQGVPLPWGSLAELMPGGLQPSNLVVVAGDPGRGKTALALNIALHAAQSGYGTCFLSLEMSRREVVNRLLALRGQFNSRVFKFSDRSFHQTQAIYTQASEVAELPLFVRDSSACTVQGLIGGIQRLRAKHDIRLLVVDYLQLMRGDGRSRVEQIDSIARGLKNAAMELQIPIIALSQLSRDHSKAGTRPELHDLKGSSEIEQAANAVMFLYGQTRYDVMPSEQLPVTLYLAKQRDGIAGVELAMGFRADCGLFTEHHA